METDYTKTHTIDVKLGINGGDSPSNPGQGVAVIHDCPHICTPPPKSKCHTVCTPSQSDILKLNKGDQVYEYTNFELTLWLWLIW